MLPSMSRRTFAAVALVLCLLPRVTRPPPLDPDEGLHAAIVQEMARDGDAALKVDQLQPPH